MNWVFGELSFGELSVGELSLGELSFGDMSGHLVDCSCAVSHPQSSCLCLISTHGLACFPILVAARVASSPEPSPISCLLVFSLLRVGYINARCLSEFQVLMRQITAKANPFVCESPAMDKVVKELSSQAMTQGAVTRQNIRMKTTSQTSECTRKFLGAKNMQNTNFARTFAIVFATRNAKIIHCERSLCKTSLHVK